MSNTATYQLSSFSGLTSAWPKVGFLRDKAEEEHEVDALVRSGDYFVTLATILDQLSYEVKDYHVRAALEEIVSELIYLQDSYQISKADD